LRFHRKRRGISEIVAVLLLVAIAVGMGVLVYTLASGGVSALAQGATGLVSNQGKAAAEQFVVEQASFATSIGALAVDGTGFSSCPTAGTSCTVTLTTSDTEDVVVLFSATNGGAIGYATISSISGGGLSWTERGRAECLNVCGTGGSGTYTDTDEWYAVSSGALSSVTFTVTLASSSSYTDLSVFGINGANTVSPFDTHSGLPAMLTGSAQPYPAVSTSNPHDIVFGAADLNVATGGVGAGFTTLGYTSGDYFADEYAIESTTQSSLTVGYSVGSTSANNAIADAVEAAPMGANLYVRSVGITSSTLVSVFVLDQSTGAFVGQFPTSTALSAGALAAISLPFTPAVGNAYSFTVTSSMGNSVKFIAEAI